MRKKPVDPYATQKDWDRAARRIGVTTEAQLRWLVEQFAAYPEHSAALRADEVPEDLALEASFFIVQQGALISLLDPPAVAAASFRKLANDVAAGLDELLNGTEWVIAIKRPLERRLRRHSRRVLGRRLTETAFEIRNSYQIDAAPAAGFLALFQLAAMDLLSSAEPWRLARCDRPDCHRRFVRHDKRQTFCSPECSQAVRTARTRHRDKTG